MNGYERRTERKKEGICRAAIQLFMEHGIRKVRISEVAKKAGVSQVTIYNYFGSKDELVLLALSYYMEAQIEEFQSVVESDRSFVEKIEWFILEKTKAFDSMSVEFLDIFTSSDPEIAIQMKRYEEKILPFVEGFIDQGKEQGYFNRELSRETLMFYMQMFSNQATQYLERYPEGEQKRHVYKELLQVFFNGVKGDSSSKITNL
ncbi:TetR/AcrR family transcriptional regulator [Bacillus horti]|uniref:AcrR family transcriptional regulator n=1 Tax=Caldalkalibacillus horti TaxID=77523 RepID=A0ABT9VU41_9BACI|nr:TetR/AcrR family transcriptional regulator [Bacillus horti]MDQ0164500.1 AcrR family transcriptional regulator [Bacillus horti]